jgi:hypothetical protein
MPTYIYYEYQDKESKTKISLLEAELDKLARKNAYRQR